MPLSSFRHLLPLLLAVAAGAAAPSAHAQCRSAAAATLPMPGVTWLRGWHGDLRTPTRLAVDAADRVAIADPGAGRVLVRGADGALLAALNPGFAPQAVAFDAFGSIWLADAAAGRVVRVDESGRVEAQLGIGEGEFGRPGDLVVDPANGEVYVSDSGRHEVRVYSANGALRRVIGGPAPADDLPAPGGQFRTPTGLAIAGDELLVADSLNYRVQAFDKTSGAYRYCLGSFRASSFFASNSGPARTFGQAQGLWVDTLGRLYVADAFLSQVSIIERGSGALIGRIGGLGSTPGALAVPSDVAIDGHGRLFVASADGRRLDVFGLDAYADPEAVVPARVSALPGTIDRAAPPPAVIFRVEAPGYRAIDIDAPAVRVNGLAATPQGVADDDGNGIPELALAVPGDALLATLAVDAPFGDGTAPVVVRGPLGGLEVVATTALVLRGESTTDGDGDGVADALDRCPATSAGDPVDAEGCAIAQRCACTVKPDDHGPDGRRPGGRPVDRDDRRDDAHHGDYVRCVERQAKAMRRDGLIDQPTYRRLVSDAARSSCGRTR